MAALLAVSFATSASAQTASFYIVQDTSTKKCMIVDKKPETTTTTTTTVIGGDKVYTTKTEAETAMKTEKICVSN